MTTTWKIESLEIKPNDGEHENVATTAHWRCIGTEGDHSTSIYGSCGINSPNGTFIEYSDLTEKEVLEWCFKKIDKVKIEEGVIAQLIKLKNPEFTTTRLPWINET